MKKVEKAKRDEEGREDGEGGKDGKDGRGGRGIGGGGHVWTRCLVDFYKFRAFKDVVQRSQQSGYQR